MEKLKTNKTSENKDLNIVINLMKLQKKTHWNTGHKFLTIQYRVLIVGGPGSGKTNAELN